MLSRAYKLRLRRRLRVSTRQMGELSTQAELHLERNFFKRLERLIEVRRFVFSWVLLVVLLIGIVVAQARSLGEYYEVTVPVAGGTHSEGMLGRFTNANPVYATGLVDSSVSRLVFAGLLTYNGQNKLVGDLAENWKADERGQTYTVRLKPGLTWHDGEPLTAEDVVFTYNVIKNPDARSPLNSTWQDIKVRATNDRTVVFELPNPLASFPYSLTNGIIPKHILGGVAMADMRSATFNTAEPVGAGPFTWQAIQVEGGTPESRHERIALRAFENYHGGKPKINSFILRTFRTTDQLVNSFAGQDIRAIAGLDSVPNSLAGTPNMRVHNMLLTAQVMSFFRTGHEVLGNKEVRRALVSAADRLSIMRNLEYPTVAVRSPLLYGQLGYDAKQVQPRRNLDQAKQILDADGWKAGQDGIRQKDGKKLAFSLYTLDNEEYTYVASELQQQWREVGADVAIEPQEESTLQSTLANHSYDALLYGISIGQDPDVFVYWHSSQADPRLASRLNFSEYESLQADAALEDARTRLDPALRAAKLEPFLAAWKADAPALGLYQPRFLYITRGPVHGLTGHPINTDAGRFANVHNWMIRETREAPQYD